MAHQLIAVTIDPAVEAELEAALAPIRAAHPGISHGEAAELLPEHLRGPLWERAVGRYLAAKLVELDTAETT